MITTRFSRLIASYVVVTACFLVMAAAPKAGAGLIIEVELLANTDGTATFNGTDWDRDFSGSTLHALDDSGQPEQRIAMDMPLPVFPDDPIEILSAVLTSEVSGFTDDSGDPTLEYYLYAGNGRVDEIDPSRGTLAGVSDPITSTGFISTVLDVSVLNAVLAGDPTHFGWVFRGGTDGELVSIYSNDGDVRGEGTRSKLTIEYMIVPEPASMLALAGLGLPMLARRRR